VTQGARVRVIVQARTTSRRLPGKVLLPLGGFPLAILCAKRLGRTGLDVVLATSTHESDDELVRLAGQAGVTVCRGSLDDVLGRFVSCVSDFADDDIAVRATADNPLPDGPFIELLLKRFVQHDLDYLGTDSPSDGLPYGLSAEVLRVGVLRRRADAAATDVEREHVTTSMRRPSRRSRSLRRDEIVRGDHSSLRCTIDTLDDYLRMTEVFRDCPDPLGTPWDVFVSRLTPSAPPGPAVADGTRTGPAILALGTAQLGAAYGIANTHGVPSDDEVASMLDLARTSGVTWLDTARAYGRAESRVGCYLHERRAEDVHVVGKVSLSDVADDAPPAEVLASLEARVLRSVYDLRQRKLAVMMFHHSQDVFRWEGAALGHLARMVGEGIVGAIGVSVYSPDEAVRCLEHRDIEHLQVPFNVLDRRWCRPAFQSALAARPDVTIHVRSVFLQGLLVSDVSAWPSWADAATEVVDGLDTLCRALNRRGRVDLCLAYVRAFPWVGRVVVGAETPRQLREIIDSAREAPLSSGDVERVGRTLPPVSERLLDPRTWS
jgi:spore coat polysaccharide biosynthesis protein SpsF (cytidylyltransferase family)/aryl-alcohol dehydrogenase-like predicted oxidoreductase